MASWRRGGRQVMASNQGQPDSLPRTSPKPKICGRIELEGSLIVSDSSVQSTWPRKMPEVTASWLKTPRPPLR